MSSIVAESDAWISAREAARILGITFPTFSRLKDSHPFTTQTLPNSWTRYSRKEVEELARKSVGKSTTTEGK